MAPRWIWNGGIPIQGSILGGFLVALWYTWDRRINFWEFADFVVPGVILGQGLGRLTACVANGDAFGRPMGSGGVRLPGPNGSTEGAPARHRVSMMTSR